MEIVVGLVGEERRLLLLLQASGWDGRRLISLQIYQGR
jgi:hypothetical protein